MKITKIIIYTFQIILCTQFTFAQKQLPGLEETEEYIVNMIKKGNIGEYHYENNPYTYYPNIDESNLKYDLFNYTTGTIKYIESINCTNTNTFQQVKFKQNTRKERIDFKKLTDIELSSSTQPKASSLAVIIRFSDDHITFVEDAVCSTPAEVSKSSHITVFLRNEEGALSRFKNAMFHYKNLLLMIEQQKRANDPFAD